jgi:hypothetical protein
MSAPTTASTLPRSVIALAFLGMAFGAEACGVFAHTMNTAAAIVLPAMAMILHRAPDPGGSRTIMRLLTLGAVAALFFVALDGEPRFFAYAAFFAALAARDEAAGGPPSRWRGLAAGAFIYGACAFLWRHGVLAWHVRDEAAESVSAAVAAAARFPIQVGPTYAGFPIATLAGACIAGTWAGRARPERQGAVAALVALAGIMVFYLVLRARLPFAAAAEDSAATALAGVVARLYPLHLTLVPVLLATLLLTWFVRLPRAALPPMTPLRAPATLALIGVATAAAAFLDVAPDAPSKRPSVAIFEPGFVNWLKPERDRYGPGSTGMMGLVADLLETRGCATEMVKELSPATLAGRDVLLVVNPLEPHTEPAVQAVEAFLRDGGRLLLLGDHTMRTKDGDVVNQLLRSTSIRFRFDTAEFFTGGWVDGYEFPAHPATARLEDDANVPGCVVGASLAVDWPAAPILVGRHGFSDPGVPAAEASGYLGNRKLDAPERIGDLCIAAAEDVGRGRVMVFGDTSAFANGIATISWPFVLRALDWLMSDAASAPALWREIAGALALAASAAIVARYGTPRIMVFSAAGAVLAVLALDAAAGMPIRLDPIGGSKGALGRPIALVDHSHATKGSLESVRQDGFSSLGIQLLRDGYCVFSGADDAWALLDGVDLRVIASPGRAFTAAEAGRVAEWVERGGSLLLGVSWNDRVAALPLLQRFGLDVRNLPVGSQLGAAPPDLTPSLWEGWAVTGGEPVAHVGHHPVATRAVHGKGRVVLIGDGHFLRDKNIETEEGPVLHNIKFLHRITAWMRER